MAWHRDAAALFVKERKVLLRDPQALVLLFAMPAFMPQTMGYSPVTAIAAQNVGLVVISVGLLFVAWLSDRVSRRTLALTGSALMLVSIYPFLAALEALVL